MIKFKKLLENKKKDEVETFKNLRGSFSFQGHISPLKNVVLSLEDTEKVAIRSGWNGHYYQPPEGFWTSTIFKSFDDFKTKWQSFWYDGDRSVSKMGRYFHAFTIRGNSKIRHVGSKKEANKLYDESKYAEEREGQKVFRWGEFAKENDALHVFGSALETRFFEKWDVESTVWFNPLHLEEQFVWKVE